MTVGDRITQLRKDRHISVTELAKYFGCSRQYIHSLERSQYPMSRAMLEKYCSFFNTSADFIMGYESEQVIPVYQMDKREMDKMSTMSIPPAFLDAGKEYFALTLGNTRLVIFERDGKLRFEKQGVFKYKDEYYLSRLERYSDGSVWLISEENRRPEKIEKINELTSLGYQSYQLT